MFVSVYVSCHDELVPVSCRPTKTIASVVIVFYPIVL